MLGVRSGLLEQQHLRYDFMDIHSRQLQFRGAGDGQEIGDHIIDAGDLGRNYIQIFYFSLRSDIRTVDRFFQDLHIDIHGVEGIADLVAHQGGEAAQRCQPFHPLQFFLVLQQRAGHRVEFLGQFRQFVFGGQVDFMGQVAAAVFPGPFDQLFQRAGEPLDPQHPEQGGHQNGQGRQVEHPLLHLAGQSEGLPVRLLHHHPPGQLRHGFIDQDHALSLRILAGDQLPARQQVGIKIVSGVVLPRDQLVLIAVGDHLAVFV